MQRLSRCLWASLLLLYLFGALSSLQAKTSDNSLELRPGTVKGVVMDQLTNAPIAFASIVIKSSDGDRILTGGITDENGKFKVEDIPLGGILFEVQFIGYENFSRELTISSKNKTLDVGTIHLKESTEELEEVAVVAERTTIEQKVDRKVINVGKDLTTSGATASDIMNNIPSVNVDSQTGDISLRGNSNVRVMVDGKLSNVPVAQLLRQIPSTSIKSIELITNPSAKYNPEGMSGLINIILHKNANIGFNGSITSGGYHRHRGEIQQLHRPELPQWQIQSVRQLRKQHWQIRQ